MKRVLFCLMVIICSLQVKADGEAFYYYYKGGKVPLALNKEMFVVLVPSETVFETSEAIRSTRVKCIPSIGYDVYVYKNRKTKGASKDMMDFRQKMPKGSIVQHCYKNKDGGDVVLTNLLDVALFSQSDYGKLEKVMDRFHLKMADHSDLMPLWYTLSITAETGMDVLAVANAIYETGLFASSSPSFLGELSTGISFDQYVDEQWGLYNTNAGCTGIDVSASAAWAYSSGSGVKIAFMDSGVYMQHPDLINNVWPISYDAVTGSGSSVRRGSHATNCAGIAAAECDNVIGIAGVAPEAKIMSVSVTVNETVFTSSTLARGISWAWKNGADVINCSLGMSSKCDNISAAIDSALCYGRNGRGCVMVAAAGNNNSLPALFPANHSDDVISVSSIKYNGEIAHYAPMACDSVDVVAPGDAIQTATYVNGALYSMVSGTSMACSHVSGIAALVLQLNPYLTATQVRDIIEENTKHVGTMAYSPTAGKPYGDWNNRYGYGLVDAYSCVVAAIGNPLNDLPR